MQYRELNRSRETPVSGPYSRCIGTFACTTSHE